jgi:hypothetical protein
MAIGRDTAHRAGVVLECEVSPLRLYLATNAVCQVRIRNLRPTPIYDIMLIVRCSKPILHGEEDHRAITLSIINSGMPVSEDFPLAGLSNVTELQYTPVTIAIETIMIFKASIQPSALIEELRTECHLMFGPLRPMHTRGHIVDAPPINAGRAPSETAIVNSANTVALAAAAAGAVNVIRNVIGTVKDSFDINKHIRDRRKDEPKIDERKGEDQA